MTRKRPALGRGLGALLPSAPAAAPPTAPVAAPSTVTDPGEPGLRTLPIERLRPNPDQPRQRFDPQLLKQLADSIRAQGIIQPIVVARDPGGGEAPYVIVAGERRWRAAQLAGLHDVAVVVRETPQSERLELALVENLQRADLNPIEEAQAFSQLIELRGYTQDELASRVGKDRSTISNALRLLRLPEAVQALVRDGTLTMGHARALLGLASEDEMAALAKQVVRDGLSVRATENAVRKRTASGPDARPDKPADPSKVIVGELETRLRRRLGVRVRLRQRAGRKDAGTLEIPYTTLDELDRVLHLILDDAAK